jgi:two-component system, NarL family, response regulator NreC
MIRILLADDHEILRDGLASIIDAQADMKIVAMVKNGRDAVESTVERKPDVAVMDISMPGLNGIDAARQIVETSTVTKVLCLSMHREEQMISAMLRAGAAGYLVKDCAGSELVDAIRAVASGKTYVSPMIATEVVQGYLSNQPESSDGVYALLSDREREVLQLIAEGQNTKEIASLLGISGKTVAAHRIKLMEKLACPSVADLTRYAIRQGLVQP